ncbi:hypothetical protein ABNB59_21345 [Paenibacillus larvae]|uniref:Uncharacterized protein n=6 Tax=Paenibacillus larvae TaxID=1464 RepID=V9WAH5_9BACL|nr:hypothetical protein [Paenibacillus larvae]UYL93218.1 hypothetical protein CALLAN_28 [Paenibacillus phage Callan]AHD06127.1 hypothetical protein ERIC2_c23390 [Paenibacillus larvae subsp. larvae DSM 25430]AQR77417.1 hypothetical protein BXP28_08725 [Paenibacillus larvae subsp. larvae]AQR77847.1 hypothetical protein BXP28_11345 [Paenibacillus larvae subsp. larvae]AVF21044.1 hypothetical protein ERICI_01142 [Paenibacillus larvae subsp. larvae]
MLKKIFWTLLILILLIILIGAGIYWYVKPQKELDLRYQDIFLKSKIIDMVKDLNTELVLSSDEINQLAKKEIAKLPNVRPDVRITGADFKLNGNELEGDINLLYKDTIPAGINIWYTMEWQDGTLKLIPKDAKIRSIHLPLSSVKLPSMSIGPNGHLLEFVKVKHVTFENQGIKITFKLNKLF